jgi:hypothetical protein
LAPALVKRDTFNQGEGSLPLQALFDRFAERARLPLLLEPTYLKEVVRLGVRGKEWLYYDQTQNLAYDQLDDLPDIAIDERHEVMTPETVKARNIPIYQKQRPEPPPPDDRKRPGDDQGHPTIDVPLAQELKAEGEPRRALAELAARAKDARWQALAALEVAWSAEGRDAQARLSAIRTILGQITAAKAALEVDVTCEFQDGAEWRTQFRGPTERYQHLDSTVETLVGQCRDAHANVSIALEFARRLPLSGTDYEDLRDILDLAGLGHTRFTARPGQGGV